MKQLNQSKFKRNTTEYQNVASPNGEVKALKVESGQLKYSTDYSQFNEIGKVYTAGNGISIDENGNAIISCLSGAGAPTTSTVGNLYQFYYDTTNNKLYQCIDINGSTYTWGSVGVDASKLVNLTTANQTFDGSKVLVIPETKQLMFKDGYYNYYHRFYTEGNSPVIKLDNYVTHETLAIHKNKVVKETSGNTYTINIPSQSGTFAIVEDMFPDFSTSSTYTVGKVVYYNGNFYKCTTAVTTAGAWNASNWTQVTLQDLFDDLNNKIGDIDTILQTLNNGGGV